MHFIVIDGPQAEQYLRWSEMGTTEILRGRTAVEFDGGIRKIGEYKKCEVRPRREMYDGLLHTYQLARQRTFERFQFWPKSNVPNEASVSVTT